MNLYLPSAFSFLYLSSSSTQAFAPPQIHLSKPRADVDFSTRRPLTVLYTKHLGQKTPDEQEVERLLRNYGEKSRLYRRDVFTAADWIRVRRPERFLDNLTTIFKSGLFQQLTMELTFIAIFSIIIVTYDNLFVGGWTDFAGSFHEPIGGYPALVLPLAPTSLSVAALGLLLTFRTNVSYSRWNEARTAWGKVINDSRSIVRMGCIWAQRYNTIDDYSLQRLGEAVCSFSRTLMNRTLPPQEDEVNFKAYTYDLSDQGFAEVLRTAKHRPTAALAEITEILVDYKLNPLHQVEIEKVVTGLCDALGASERIFTSPVPTFYTRHTARFLAIWLLGLPLALYEPFKATWNHYGVIPAVLVIGVFLLGIEELATQMEEPFSILPMEKMCEGSIRTPVMEQVKRSQNPRERTDLELPWPNLPQPLSLNPVPAAVVQTKVVNGGSSAESHGVNGSMTGENKKVNDSLNIEELNRQWAKQSGSQFD